MVSLRYRGTPCLSRVLVIVLQGNELKALTMSRNPSLGDCRLREGNDSVYGVDFDCPTRNPNWSSEISGPMYDRWMEILFAIILSRSFSISFRRQIRLDDDGESISFFLGIGIRTRLFIFPTLGNIPVWRHLLKKFFTLSLSSLMIVTRTRPSTPSGPGAVFSSSLDIVGGVGPGEEDLLAGLSSCELGKRVSKMFSSVRGSKLSVMGNVLGRSFPKTRRYGRPHGSWSMMLRSSPQEWDLATLICNCSLVVTVLYCWCRISSCARSRCFLLRARWKRRRGIMHSVRVDLIFFDHQYAEFL